MKKLEYLVDIYFKNGNVKYNCIASIIVDEDKDYIAAINEEIDLWNLYNYDKEERRVFKGIKY